MDTPSPLRIKYHQFLEDIHGEADSAQLALIEKLERVYADLTAPPAPSLIARLLHPAPKPSAQNLYIWGKVGRGKTALMDLFCEVAPAPKWRVHFYDFMRHVHAKLHALRQSREGLTSKTPFDAITPVARGIAARTRLLCFDEFAVTDIADAMILARLFTALLAEGMVIVATSNVPPDRLYENGLNRALFLPFIDLLKARFDVVTLDSAQDYRETYAADDALQSPLLTSLHTPLNAASAQALEAVFEKLAPNYKEQPTILTVLGRRWEIARTRGRVALMTFAELCEDAHGANDFLALAQKFDTLVVAGVPKLSAQNREAARRFIMLIDTLYDRHVKLYWSAAYALDDLMALTGDDSDTRQEGFAFARTKSRLVEMGGAHWLTSPPWGGRDLVET